MSSTAHDPRVLRAIAHPVRNRILDELSATGPMRAADVARALHIPANQASFHLRQLAKYGLVEEDPAAARDRRDRVWRSTNPEGLMIEGSDIALEPAGAAALKVFMRNSAAWSHHVVDESYGEQREPDTRRSQMQYAVRLTKEEAGELTADLAALMGRWVERTRGSDDARRTYLTHVMLLPYPAVERPTGDDD